MSPATTKKPKIVRFGVSAIREQLFGKTDISLKIKLIQIEANQIAERVTQRENKEIKVARRSSSSGLLFKSSRSLIVQKKVPVQKPSVFEIPQIQKPSLKSAYITRQEDSIILTSPTFGDKMTIQKPTMPIMSYTESLASLKHVEKQLMQSNVLPDFGYNQDNYLIDRSDKHEKWKTLLGLIGDQQRFEYLMHFITLSKLQKQVQISKENEHKDRAARLQKQLEEKLMQENGGKLPKQIVVKGKQEMDQLLELHRVSIKSFSKFRKPPTKEEKRPLTEKQFSRKYQKQLELRNMNSQKTKLKAEIDQISSFSKICAQEQVNPKVLKNLQTKSMELRQSLKLCSKKISPELTVRSDSSSSWDNGQLKQIKEENYSLHNCSISQGSSRFSKPIRQITTIPTAQLQKPPFSSIGTLSSFRSDRPDLSSYKGEDPIKRQSLYARSHR